MARVEWIKEGIREARALVIIFPLFPQALAPKYTTFTLIARSYCLALRLGRMDWETNYFLCRTKNC
jgi:hypothetical protein